MQERDRLGQEIGQYRLLEVLGRGGMGVVYRARDTALDRDVAIKMLAHHVDEPTTREYNARFHSEAKAAAGIRSRHVAQVMHLGTTDDGQSYIVMELLEGKTLLTLLMRERRVEPRRAVRIARQVAKGLQAAHALGVVHRDLKPSNVMLESMDGEEEVAKVLDFGIAKRLVPSPEDHVTQHGALLGTLQFMAPEQLSGAPIDARTDIYSLGVLLYRMLTGTVPFEANSLAEMVDVQLRSSPRTMLDRLPSLSPALDDIVLICLAKNPDQRWASMADLERALANIYEDKLTTPPRARPAPLVGATLPMGATAQALLAEQAALLADATATPRPRNPREEPEFPEEITAPVVKPQVAKPMTQEISDLRAFEASLKSKGMALPALAAVILVGALVAAFYLGMKPPPDVPVAALADGGAPVWPGATPTSTAGSVWPGANGPPVEGSRSSTAASSTTASSSVAGATTDVDFPGQPLSATWPPLPVASAASSPLTPPPSSSLPASPPPTAAPPAAVPPAAAPPAAVPPAAAPPAAVPSKPADVAPPPPPEPKQPPAEPKRRKRRRPPPPPEEPAVSEPAEEAPAEPVDKKDGFLRVHTKGDE